MSHNESIDTNYGAGSTTLEQPLRLSTETKASTKTTEFFVFLAAVAAVVVTALWSVRMRTPASTRSAPWTRCGTSPS